MNEENKEDRKEEGGQESKQEEIVTPPATPAEPQAPVSSRPKVDFDENDPNSPLWDEETKQWLDRKTLKPLRDQNPGIINDGYVGKHDVNDVDDRGDAEAMRR